MGDVGLGMFRIAVCDDEATSLMLLTALVKKICEEEQIAYELVAFSDMKDMISALSNTIPPYNLLITDIMTDSVTGIDAAKQLRKYSERLDIVFVSSTAAYALEGYTVQALRYLQKPVQLEDLRDAVLQSFRKQNRIEELLVSVDGVPTKFPYKDLLYIESDTRNAIIVTKDRSVPLKKKISDIEKILPEQHFFRCHRTHIVNLDEVERIERYEATLKNGMKIPISQPQYNEMKKRFYKY